MECTLLHGEPPHVVDLSRMVHVPLRIFIIDSSCRHIRRNQVSALSSSLLRHRIAVSHLFASHCVGKDGVSQEIPDTRDWKRDWSGEEKECALALCLPGSSWA
jgi:hypothetical protein